MAKVAESGDIKKKIRNLADLQNSLKMVRAWGLEPQTWEPSDQYLCGFLKHRSIFIAKL